MLTKGLLIRLEVIKGKEKEAEKLLKKIILPIGTIACFMIRFKEGHYGIFGAFNSNKNRIFYLKSIALRVIEQKKGIIFSNKPMIEKLDILADKLPSAQADTCDTKAILMTFKGKENQEYKTEDFLRNAKILAEAEPETSSWFALSFDNGDYGIFDVFPNSGARLNHLTGKIPKRMIKKAPSILDSIPEMHLLDILTESLVNDAKMEAAFIQEGF